LGFYILGYLLYREWGKRLTAKPNAVIRAVSDCSYMTYLMHMVFITPFYMLVGFSGATAPLWQLIIMPISTSVLVVTICTFGGILIKKLLPFYRYLGIN
jgi:membrane-bound acyltransferase YfiQ involved in biofilm formation